MNIKLKTTMMACGICLCVTTSSVYAGLFDDIGKSLQKGLENSVKGTMKGGNSFDSDEDEEDEDGKMHSSQQPVQADPVHKTKPADNAAQSITIAKQSSSGGFTLTGVLNRKFPIKKVLKYAKQGQYGNDPDDYAVLTYVAGARLPPGSTGRCDIFIYDQFYKRDNFAKLRSIKKSFRSMINHKVELVNVRTAAGTTACTFSDIRSLGRHVPVASAPKPVSKPKPVSQPKPKPAVVASTPKPVSKPKPAAVAAKPRPYNPAAINSPFAGVNINGIKLCGSYEQALRKLRRDGYFSGMSDSQFEKQVQHNGASARKSQGGVNYRFQLLTNGKDGLLDMVNYTATGLADTVTPFENAKQAFESKTGIKTGCHEGGRSINCSYHKNNNYVSFVQKYKRQEVRLRASTVCAK